MQDCFLCFVNSVQVSRVRVTWLWSDCGKTGFYWLPTRAAKLCLWSRFSNKVIWKTLFHQLWYQLHILCFYNCMVELTHILFTSQRLGFWYIVWKSAKSRCIWKHPCVRSWFQLPPWVSLGNNLMLWLDFNFSADTWLICIFFIYCK